MLISANGQCNTIGIHIILYNVSNDLQILSVTELILCRFIYLICVLSLRLPSVRLGGTLLGRRLQTAMTWLIFPGIFYSDGILVKVPHNYCRTSMSAIPIQIVRKIHLEMFTFGC